MQLIFASRGSTRHYDGWYSTPEGRRDKDGTVLEGPYVPYDASMAGDGDMNIQELRTKKNSSEYVLVCQHCEMFLSE